jgi:hypothetical protein
MQACLHRTWSVFADKYRMLVLFASSDTCHRTCAVSLAADLRSRPPIPPKHQVYHMMEPYRFPIPLSDPTARLSKPRPTDFSHQIQWHVCRLEYVVQKRKRIRMVVRSSRMSSYFNPQKQQRGAGTRPEKLQAGSGEIRLRSVPPIGMIVDPAPHGDETLRVPLEAFTRREIMSPRLGMFVESRLSRDSYFWNGESSGSLPDSILWS